MSNNDENSNHLDSLYQEIILDHHKDPRHFGELKDANRSAEGFNPMCGDRVNVQLKVDEQGSCVLDQAFSGEGCSICMASASMMTEELEGLDLKQALKKVQLVRDVMQGKEESSKIEGDLEALAGVKNFPVRIKCALLPWTTLNKAIEDCPVMEKLAESKKEKEEEQKS